MRTRLLASTAAFVLLASPAYSQGFGMGDSSGGQKTRYSEQEKREEALNERAYRDALKATRSTTGEAYDPWRNIRSTAPEKPEAKRR